MIVAFEERKKVVSLAGNNSGKMGTMPVHRLFITMSIPLIISMMVQTLYNIVDSIFVSYISEEALTAVSLVSPFMNLMFAVAGGTGVGFNALIARRLGQKNQEAANRTANNGILLIIISYLVFLCIGLAGTNAFITMQTDDPAIIEAGVTYMKIVTCLSIGMFGQVAIERLLQATGRTVFPMITQMSGALVNILFDWLLVFGIGVFPKMGVAGAAMATIFGQCVACTLGIIFNKKYNTDVELGIRYMKPDIRLIGNIYKIGIPAIIMISISSIMTFGMNSILMSFSATAVAVFGIYFKLQGIVFMPAFGMNNAMIPIIGYNLGAGNFDRIKKVVKIASIYAIAVMWAGFVLFETAPVVMLRLFNASDNMLSIGVPALRISCIIFLFAGFSVIISGLFQASGKSVYSMIVSLIRQLFVMLPAAFLLARLGKINLVWWSIPISEFVGFIATLFLLYKLIRFLAANRENFMKH